MDANSYEEAADELPPEYEPADLPQYEHAPVVSLRLMKTDRKLQFLHPLLSSNSTSYRIVHRSAPSMFSKQADMSLFAQADAALPERCVARINFDNDGPLPWRPRAQVESKADESEAFGTSILDARNFADWTFKVNNTTFKWSLDDTPVSLVLGYRGFTTPVARFTYSDAGTAAKKGCGVGILDITDDPNVPERLATPLIIGSCLLVVEHWRRMGRHWNNLEGSCTRQNSLATVRSNISASSMAESIGVRSLSVSNTMDTRNRSPWY